MKAFMCTDCGWVEELASDEPCPGCDDVEVQWEEVDLPAGARVCRGAVERTVSCGGTDVWVEVVRHDGCPNCGEGRGWVEAVRRDQMCSRRCALQWEYAQRLRKVAA